ncbi:hypothetical protein ACFLZ9_02400 [Patescibacteria group bacterium]
MYKESLLKTEPSATDEPNEKKGEAQLTRRGFLKAIAAIAAVEAIKPLDTAAKIMDVDGGLQRNNFSEEELFKTLKTANYNKEEIDSLFKYIKESKVPLEDIQTILRNKSEKSDVLMMLKTYAVAYDAVLSYKLEPKIRENFQKHVLQNIKDGIIDVVRVSKEFLTQKTKNPEAQAAYDSEEDALYDTGVSLSDIEDRSTVIHELTHIVQDGRKKTAKVIDNEFEAFITQYNYALREQGLIQGGYNGETIFKEIETTKDIKGGDPNLLATDVDSKLYVIFKHALENILAGNNHLNKISYDGKVSLDKVPNDTEKFCREMIKIHESNIRFLWQGNKSAYSVNNGFSRKNKKRY